MIYDAVIIGSGFGGAVMACRLAAAGRSVLVLERGRRWETDAYPRGTDDAWIWDTDEPERQNGWIDLRFMDDMWVAQGAGVGGGSLIYANVSIDAPESAFRSGWPSAITLDGLRPWYERAGDMLNVQRIPANQWTKRTQLMHESAHAIGEGARFSTVDLAVTFDRNWSADRPDATKQWVNAFGMQQGTCIHCGNCDIGCPVKAKNTLDLNYLAAAERDGAEIETLALVSHVASAGDRWLVYYDKLEGGGRTPAHVYGRKVFLAAGSLGSTEILLRSRDQYRTLRGLPALGMGWSSNGDFLTPAFYANRTISPSVGPTITSAIDFLDGSEKGARFFVEDGGFPNVIGNYVAASLQGRRRSFIERRFLKLLKKAFGKDPLDNMMPWFGQGFDGADGKLYLGRRWTAPWRRTLKLDWNPSRSEKAVGGLVAMHRRLSEATGGEAKVPPSWTVFRNLVTPHPLGGCNMAASPAAGVVDDGGQVFGHPNLYVVDGSIVPRPIGLNPSKTIAALAERIAHRLCA